VNLNGLITRIFKSPNNSDGVPFRASPMSSIAVALTEPPYFELTRHGQRFHGGTQLLANAVAPVQVIPTTVATLALYNTDTNGNGLALVPDWLNVYLASGTPAAGLSVMLAVGKPTTAPTANATGYASGPLSGTGRSSRALWGAAVPFPAGVVWSAPVSTFQPAAANVGQGDNYIDLGGRIVIPPGYALGIAVLSGVGTTPLFAVNAQWSEVETDLV
jgi:hypothetical protein